MKKIKLQKITVLVFFFLLGITQPTQAQFFKKLANRAEEKIKQEAERRAQRRVDGKIDKTFDKAENGVDGKLTKKSKKRDLELPTKYSFDWNMTMKMTSKDGEMNMHYLLKQDATYFGVKMDMPNKVTKNMVTIMDMENNATITLMNMQGNKIKRVMDIPDDAEDNNDSQNITITETDTKTILNYLCQGYKMKTDEGTINMYIAINAPVSFNRGLDGNTKLPKGFNKSILKKLKNGLMMEMIFMSKKKKKNNVTMLCTSLKKEKISVNTKGYKSFGF